MPKALMRVKRWVASHNTFTRFKSDTAQSCREKAAGYQQLHCAMIIGIDHYPYLGSDLEGAVADARAMKDFVETQLGVPARRIIYLENGAATRKTICQGFVDLRDMPGLEPGHSTLIYYAGHGTLVKREGDAQGSVGVIVPSDCDFSALHPIPDTTIDGLLGHIYARTRNISTLITDCCRSPLIYHGLEGRARSVSVRDDYFLPNHLDDALFRAQPPIVGQFTRIHLAACGKNELALESNGRGEFTKALIPVFGSPDRVWLTYDDVLARLERGLLEKQNPQCRGNDRHRLLFTGAIPSHLWHRVFKNEHGQYILEAGSIQGISLDARFRVYQARSLEGPTATMQVNEVELLHSVLEPLENMVGVSAAFALQETTGTAPKLAIYIDEHLSPLVASIHAVTSEDERSEAAVEITMSGLSCFSIHHIDHQFTQHGSAGRTGFPIDSMGQILSKANHFYRHLNIRSDAGDIVRIEFLEIIQASQWNSQLGPNLISNGKIELEVGAKLPGIDHPRTRTYAFRITNLEDFPLYLSLLYLDGYELDITWHYQSGRAGPFKTDPCLEPHASLMLGLGADNFTFTLPHDTNFGIDFFKFLFTSKPADFSTVATRLLSQPQPDQVKRPSLARSMERTTVTLADCCHTVLVPVILKKVPEAGPAVN